MPANLDLDRQEYESDEVADYLFDNQSLRLRTIMIAQCIDFNAEKNTVNVQPLLKRKINGILENMPVITDVPVGFYGAGGMVVTFEPQKGDTCALWISDRSLEQWKLKGGITDPGMGRHHHFTDAIAYFGLNAFNDAYPEIKSGMDIRSRDGSTSFNVLPGIVNLTINGANVALLSQDQVTFFVPVVAPEISTASGINLSTHRHSGVQTGGSNTGIPTP